MMRIDICIFLFVLTTTFVYACSPMPGGGGGGDSGGGDGGGGGGDGKGDSGTTPTSTTKKDEKRRKRSVDLAESGKCQGVELNIITNEDNTSQETFNIVEKLESKIKSLGQELNYNNTMDNMKLESAGGDMLKLIYKVDSECNAVRHVMLDALTKIEMAMLSSAIFKYLMCNAVTASYNSRSRLILESEIATAKNGFVRKCYQRNLKDYISQCGIRYGIINWQGEKEKA